MGTLLSKQHYWLSSNAAQASGLTVFGWLVGYSGRWGRLVLSLIKFMSDLVLIILSTYLVANFAAYTFAPPVLVTPLGALSVLIGYATPPSPAALPRSPWRVVLTEPSHSRSAVLASFLLGEQLGRIGISGCSLCIVGSLIIVLHAPEDKVINTVDEILEYALQPGFMLYCTFVLVFCVYMIYVVAPKHGQTQPLVYISICSLAGSVSVMAVKGFGVAVKLTFAGNNQLWRAGTWIFAATVVGCIAVQMNYFNKALDVFPTTVSSRHPSPSPLGSSC